MASDSFRFDRFHLDPHDRRLWRDDGPVELNARYLDALVLLVREEGRLVSKDRFLDEVWRGVPVTDEALTQCIRTLRRQLGDDASRPRFIETVPKHGYRFLAPVERLGGDAPVRAAAAPERPRPGETPSSLVRIGGLGLAGGLGGAAAGAVGGLFYSLFVALQPGDGGMGAASVLVVLVTLTALVGLLGGGGVGLGLGAAVAGGRGGPWLVAGGAAGGLVVGAVVKLIGLDAFNLLFGRSPGDVTGAPEGLLLGAAVGLGAWLGRRDGRPSVRRGATAGALSGAAAGVAVVLAGGRLMAGSLDLLVRGFPGSRLSLDPLGALFGEPGFGRLSQGVAAGLEGGLFVAAVVAAVVLARRRLPA